MNSTTTLSCRVFIREGDDPALDSEDTQALYIDNQLFCYRKTIDVETLFKECDEYMGRGAEWVISLSVQRVFLESSRARWPAHVSDVEVLRH